MTSPLGLPPVRILRPALWSAAAVGTVYVGCAAYEVHHDATLARKMHERSVKQRYGPRTAPPPMRMRDIDYVRAVIGSSGGYNPLAGDVAGSRTKGPASVLSSFTGPLVELSEPAKLMGGLVTANIGVFALERLLPGLSPLFSHMPAAALGASARNFTLLTSAFGHVGPVHLALNMYGVFQFLPTVALSPTFQASGSHLAAFYLSSGILAAYVFHLASIWPRPQDRLVGARGASGAVMAVVGAFGASFPDRHLGIVLIPGSLPASQFLVALALFEAYGLFVGYPRLPLAHAAHLSGLAIGAAYVYWGGRERVWQPARRWAFRQLQRVDMV